VSRQVPLHHVRNIGIMAHIDAGKTTLSERILFYTGRNYRLGEVHDGTATMDWMPQERERGITITAASTSVTWNDHRINLIDTPGHVDFTVEVERSLRVLDGAVALFCGVGGVEPQSVSVWRQAAKYEVPVIAFVNKLDRPGADFAAVVEEIRNQLGANAVPLAMPYYQGDDLAGLIDLLEECLIVYDPASQGAEFTQEPVPPASRADLLTWRGRLVERLSETDAALFEKYCHGQPISVAELKAAIRRATLARRVVPVLCGSAFKNVGVQKLLDAVIDYLPSPSDLPPVIGKCLARGTNLERAAEDAAPLAALAFKVQSDRHMGKLVYFRVYSGTMRTGTQILNAGHGTGLRVGRLLEMHANKPVIRDAIPCGEIGVALSLGETSTGDTLCDPDHPILLEAIEFPAPVLSVSVEPTSRADRDRLADALARLAEEDPTFVVNVDPETQETILSGMGELHLDILLDRLRREFDVSVRSGAPQVAYRETLKTPATVLQRHVKQTGGHGQFAQVELTLEPGAPGSGFEFVNAIRGGAIPKEYIPAVEKGIIDAMRKGPYAGFPVVDVKAVLSDGKHHEVDSSDLAFRICATAAFRQAFAQGAPHILEPVVSVHVTCPTTMMGVVNGDLAARRGRVAGTEMKGDACEIHGTAPLAEMFGYATTLRTLSHGQATFTMHFEHYEPVPSLIAEKIVAERRSAKGSGFRIGA
jgi:elongation factor G